ncbi:hypothetical protein FA13DRAFT_1738102 [Coprinellus micaceus]|uniref:BTB domain-containing protein n=1 Tax=Coprinellus micaceus TaxID=71717 RepID=A0A4Y7SVX0_COPMI|nr:hypothetical protein FA13DRAFT_1738102 [Coprinellus micaceus]
MPNPSTNVHINNPSRSSRFYHDTVVFEIEGTLYRVSKARIQRWSPSFFCDLFSLPQASGIQREGDSDENPIRPPQVTVIYPNQLSGPPELSKDQWIGVLRLSRQWDMPEVATLAIEKLDTLLTTPLEKAQLCRAHSVLKWMKDGYSSLVECVPATSFESLQTLGLETACRILCARNDILLTTTKRDNSLYCGNCLRCKGTWRRIVIQPQGSVSDNSDPYKCTNCNVSAETSYDGALIYLRPSTVDPAVIRSAIESKVIQVFQEEIKSASEEAGSNL